VTFVVGRRCECGCGELLPPDMRPQARYLNGSHRATASRVRRGLDRQKSPGRPGEPHRKRTKAVRRHLVTVTLTPAEARASVAWLKRKPAGSTPGLVRALEAGLARYDKKVAKQAES